MIGYSVKTTSHFDRVQKAADRAIVRNLFRAASALRRSAIESIKTGPPASDDPTQPRKKRGKRRRPHRPSAPGTPPHTNRGHARRAILFAVDKAKLEAVIGPRASVVGESMAAHEFGKQYRGNNYPARPFMGPALDRTQAGFGQSFQTSIGE